MLALPAYRVSLDVAWRQWDEAVVVYNDSSGETHCLNGVEGAAFAMLTAAPATIDDLRAELATIVDPASEAELPGVLRAAIDLLGALGLIEPSGVH